MAHRYVRTARHPAIDELARHGLDFEALRRSLRRGRRTSTTSTAAIADDLVAAAAEHGEICYAVPGNPAVAERTVTLLRDADAAARSRSRSCPGISFADLAWSRLGRRPDGRCARSSTGSAFAVDAAGLHGPLLIGALHQPDRALRHQARAARGAAARRAGHRAPAARAARRARSSTVALEDARPRRRARPPHVGLRRHRRTSRSPASSRALVALSERLRGAGRVPVGRGADPPLARPLPARGGLRDGRGDRGAPGRRARGRRSTPRRYAQLEDELGDLLYQVVFHSVLAREAGAFTIADVARGIHEKLVRRHPHVFGDVEADTVSEVMTNWEQIKKREKGSDSIVEGISPGLRVAALRAQALPQGGVGRARARHDVEALAGRDRARRSRDADVRDRGRARRPARRGRRAGRARGRRRRVRARGLVGAGSGTASCAWSSSPRRRASTSRPATADRRRRALDRGRHRARVALG